MERLTLAALIAVAGFVAAHAHAAQDVHWYTQVENDVLGSTDRWYTSGFRLARTHRVDDASRVELGIVQEIYTPDPRPRNLIDRPYAARFFLFGAWHMNAPGLYRTLELGAGVRGPSAYGRQTTEFIHRIVPALEFDWSGQLPNRLDAQAVAVQTHEFPLFAAHRARWALHYGGVAGTTLGFAHVGAELRTGGGQAIPSSALRFAATPPIAANGEAGWSAFAGASARWIGRNTLLSKNANAFGPPLERERMVRRLAAGIAWAARCGALTFTGVQDSREFETQSRAHTFGIVALRLDFL
jgi:lipid A 3-O-deacylase